MRCDAVTALSRSIFSWLDCNGARAESRLGFVSALNEPAALDEMGIGWIRDTISDRAPTSMRNCRRRCCRCWR